MVAFEGRVGDLVDVEHVPFEVGRQVGQGCGHADPAYFALGAHVLQRLHEFSLLTLGYGRVVQLHYVDGVDAQTVEALVEAAEGVLPGPDVAIRVAAAFGGEDKFVTTVAKVAADHFLAVAVVVGCVDKVDTGVEDGVELGVHLFVGHGTAMAGAKSEPGNFQAGTTEGCGWEDMGHREPFLVCPRFEELCRKSQRPAVVAVKRALGTPCRGCA